MSSKPKYEVGETVGAVRITDIQRDGYFQYELECLKCGRTFTTTMTAITGQQYAKYGCPECRKTAKENEKVQRLASQYVGKRYGRLLIQSVHVKDYEGKIRLRKDGAPMKHRVVYATCLCDCGHVSDIPLNRIASGPIRQCAQCAQANLEAGYEVARSALFEGTHVFQIDDRAINRNNTTGVKGVSRTRGGRYRAYINLARKQINLGVYWTLEEAKAAREAAEQSIYKPIVDRWEKEQKQKQNNEGNNTNK